MPENSQRESASAAILVVDDEAAVRKSLRRNLEPLGVPVATAAGGGEALQWMRENKAAVIVADHRMPGMDGLEFLRKASELQPESRRMMLTGCGDLAMAVEAMEADLIERYMTKPWEPDKLRKAVRALARGDGSRAEKEALQ